MRTVQDRLLTQMVSRHDRFEVNTFLLLLLFSLKTTINVIRFSGVNVIKPSVYAFPSRSTRGRSKL